MSGDAAVAGSPEDAGGSRRDLSVSIVAANVYAVLTALPPILLFGGFFVWRWGWTRLGHGLEALVGDLPLFILLFAAGVVAHELLHGLAWMATAGKSLSAVKFGFQWKTLTPYIHCREPMPVGPYRIGVLLPAAVLGFLPASVAIFSGNGWLIAFALLFITAAGGDFFVLWLLRSVSRQALVADHPSRAGCYVIEPSSKVV